MPVKKSQSADRKQVSRVRRPGGIATRILLVTWVMFIILSAVIALISYQMYRDGFFDYSNELCLGSNSQAAYIIDGDLVEHYAETLTVDEEYRRFSAKLDQLKSRISAKYFYILADTGEPGMFTYIYDAGFRENNPGKLFALGALETKESFEGGQEVLDTGIAFDHAVYYSESYGELYYAYAPIFNSRGDVVAFVGTAIDITPLYAKMSEYSLLLFAVIAVSFLAFAAIYFLFISRSLTAPLAVITQRAAQLVDGQLTGSLPPAVLKRTDEIGQLGTTYDIVAHSMVRLVLDIEELLRSARGGHLDKRAPLGGYQGEYEKMISGVNMTLDVVCWHFDALPEAVAFFGPDKIMRFGNRSMHRLLSRHMLEPAAATLLDSILPEDAEQGLVDAFFTAGDNKPFVRDWFPPTDRNGEEWGYSVTLLRTFVSAFSGGGASAHLDDERCVMLIVNDVTSLVRARNEAETASHAKSDFLSRMSHEIRTPLNAIIGMAQIATGSDDMEKVQLCLSKVESSSTHLLGIINDILDLSKIEAGKLELDMERFSLHEDISFVATMMASRAKERDITLDLADEGVTRDTILADSLRLNQVLINLLSNAIKFSEKGGSVQLSYRELSHRSGRSVYEFSVTDHGIGIEPAAAARLFRPFEQADSSISRTHGGTGLGLAISKSIVEMMGGSISVDSRPGNGSVFTFTIRASSTTDALEKKTGNAEEQDAASYDFTGKRILIVDDIEINREIIIELLRDTGIETDFAENGRMAVDRFREAPPEHYDIIFMDMQMPVLDGCSATEEIRALDRPDAKTVTIIAMTANVMKEDINKALASGMDGHLGKPIDIAAMLQVIGSALGR